jgi:hypothetical protein
MNIWKFWRTIIVIIAPIVLSPLLIKLEGESAAGHELIRQPCRFHVHI